MEKAMEFNQFKKEIEGQLIRNIGDDSDYMIRRRLNRADCEGKSSCNAGMFERNAKGIGFRQAVL